MLDSLRTLLHQALTSPRGDSVVPVRLAKQAVQGLNNVLDQPLCSAEDLATRRAAARRLEELRSGRVETTRVKRDPTPVMVYFEKDRNARELSQILEVLTARDITPKLLDVSGDEATMAFVMREAGCERDELPVVFVGSTVIGGFRPLVAANASGLLMKTVFGE